LSAEITTLLAGKASDGLEAVQKADELQPDLIVLDLGLSNVEWNRSRSTNPQALSSLNRGIGSHGCRRAASGRARCTHSLPL
jgi:CheY-like chemotaxis protein